MPACPTPELLSGLLSASLTAEEEARLRAHLGECAACRAVLDHATDDPDLARSAGRARTPSPYDDEPALARLVSRLAQPSEFVDLPVVRPPTAIALGPPRVQGDLGTLGPYRIVREVGRGGLGVVFEGYDETLGRAVAIKRLYAERVDGEDRRQLAREARHAARFRHDHVVVVHAVEETADGLPFIVMEYIPGPSVAELLCERTRLAPRQAAELAAQAADGLAAAHQAGLIHRDIKPANLLVDPATGRARIVDFGLAHVADAPGSIPDGTLVGTPSYMSPEQAGGQHRVDARTDQYSLGASLYELLTGEPPFRGTPARVVHQILEDEPRPPRQLNEAIPRDLETICLKTLAKDPRQRYPTAADLAADLRRWLRGEPILARPIGPAGRLVRWARRNRRVATLAATTFLLLTVLALGALVAAARIERARRLAIAERNRADLNADQARAAAQLAAERARVAGEQRTLALDTISTLINEIQEQLGHSAGTLALRRRLGDIAMTRLERIAHDPSGGSDVALARILAQERLGELAFLAGRTDAARKSYEAARDQAEALAATPDGETGVEANRLRARCLDKLGDLALAAANLDEAGTRFHQALALRESMPDSSRQGPDGLRSRAVSHNKLGDLAMRCGRLDEARSAYQRGLALIERDQDPDDQRHRFDLRFTHSRLGDVHLAQCEFDAADRAYRQALRYAQAQIAADPNDVRAQREVPVCYSKLGTVALRRAEPAAALAFYRKYLAGCEALAAASPSSAEARRDLMVAQSLVGDALFAGEDYPAADRTYRQALDLAQALSRDDPRSVQKRSDAYVLIWKIAEMVLRRERFREAAEWMERARVKVREMAQAGLITPAIRADLDAACATEQAVVGNAQRALDEPAWIASQPPKIGRRLWGVRSLILARRGEVRAAAESAETLRRLAADDVDGLVVVARAYAACLKARSVSAAGVPATNSARPRPYAVKAVAALRDALRLRPTLLQDGWLDPDLNPLYAFPEYRVLLAEAGARRSAG